MTIQPMMMDGEGILRDCINGYTFTNLFFIRDKEERIYAKRKTNDTYIGLQCLFVDFDFDEPGQKAPSSIEEFIKGIPPEWLPTGIYETFSSKPEAKRYRMFWMLDKVVYGINDYHNIFNYVIRKAGLNRLFDTAAKKPAQWLFGSFQGAENRYFGNVVEVPEEMTHYIPDYAAIEAAATRIDNEEREYQYTIKSIRYMTPSPDGSYWLTTDKCWQYKKRFGVDKETGKKGAVIYKDGNHRKKRIRAAADVFKYNNPDITEKLLAKFLKRFFRPIIDTDPNMGKAGLSEEEQRAYIANNKITDSFYSTVASETMSHDQQYLEEQRMKNLAKYPNQRMQATCANETHARWEGCSTTRQIYPVITAERRLTKILESLAFDMSLEDNVNEYNFNNPSGRSLSIKSLRSNIEKVLRCLDGDGIIRNKRGIETWNVRYHFNEEWCNILRRYAKDNGIEVRRRGRKRRDTISLIKDYCIHNYLSFDNLSSKDVERIGRSLGISIKTVRNYLYSEKSFGDKYPKNNNNNNNTTYIVANTGIFGQDVTKENAIIDSLTRGITIKDISISLGLTERTIKRNIKKAKEAGIIRNEGTRKNPKWVMTSENIQPESLDSISKEKEIIKEEIKEKTIKDMNTNDYNFDEFLNDVMPNTPTVPDLDFGNCVSDYSSAVTQSSPTVSVAMPEEAEMEAIDEEFKAKAKTVFNDNLNEPSATEDDLPEDMPEDMMNITMDVKPVKAMRYISNRDEPDTGVIPTEGQRKELRGKLAAIIARYDSDVEGVVRKCKGFYFSFSLLVSGNDMYRNNPWRKSMEDEMNCSDTLIGQLFLELKSEMVVAA